MKKNGKEDQRLPLFEYAKRFEDFAAFEDFDQYFAYCIQTSGFKMHAIAEWMRLSQTALSIRLNLTDPEQPRFNSRHIDAYIKSSGDSRPAQYLEWRAKQAQFLSQDLLKERITRILPHIEDLRKLLDAFDGKDK